MPVPTETANEKKEMETMIFGLHPLFGFLPLLLYIVLMLMGKELLLSLAATPLAHISFYKVFRLTRSA